MKNKIIYSIIVIFVFSLGACTKLNEHIYSQLSSDNFYKNKDEVLSAVLRPYTHTNAWISPGQLGWWRVSALSADQVAWPVKGPDGQDGGNWIRLHDHTWVANDDDVNNPWTLMWWGLGLCNEPIGILEARDVAGMGITTEERDEYVAELKLLHAFYYIRIMDLWGNVPIITKVGEPLSPPTAPRKDVFDFIEKEIKDNIDKVPDLSSSMMGRMSKAGAYAMLAELYLNAQVWSGTPRWDDCIAACDALINNTAGGENGALALDPDIEAPFMPDNYLSKEIIFCIAYNYQKGNFSPQWPGDFYHFNEQYIYGGTRNGNNGVVLIPGVYSKYQDNDLRKKDWFLIGPQYYYNDPTKPVTGIREYSGKPLIFVDNIRRNSELQPGQDPSTLPSNMTTGEENSGVRFFKYQLGALTDPNYNSTNWSVYRLTWIYFAKAEALMRKNGGVATQEAVDLINTCKKRCFSAADWPTEAYTTATLTMDELLAERGREFIFEGFRREDLIRFDKFVSAAWWDHTPSNDKNKELFPIPFNQIAINPNLVQNPGYQ